MDRELRSKAAVILGIFVYGTISWLLGVGGRAALLPVEEAPGVAMTVLTVFATVAIGFLLLGWIAWSQNGFEY